MISLDCASAATSPYHCWVILLLLCHLQSSIILPQTLFLEIIAHSLLLVIALFKRALDHIWHLIHALIHLELMLAVLVRVLVIALTAMLSIVLYQSYTTFGDYWSHVICEILVELFRVTLFSDLENDIFLGECSTTYRVIKISTGTALRHFSIWYLLCGRLFFIRTIFNYIKISLALRDCCGDKLILCLVIPGVKSPADRGLSASCLLGWHWCTS